MSRIKILPEIISNKIAAGEVVERPASVVKELVENAIDAQSTRIMVEIEKGGRSMIRISDNGMGMNHDDALLSLERYATSKIHNDSDLFSIQTLGFRGEALPSIASVSRFSMITRDELSETGVHIQVDGGKIKKVSEIGAPTGTMITVQQLFYNTPARRKFLKSVNTEMGHIAETVASIALGCSKSRFRLHHNGKTVKDWPLAPDPFDRVLSVLGRDMRGALHKIAFETMDVSISGWISAPTITRSTSQKIYLYVNGRYIRDRGLQHALFEGYRGRLMKGRFPVAVLFIDVPFEQLDVNVHPTKHEVRFSGYRNVYDALKAAVFKSWDDIERSKWELAETPAIDNIEQESSFVLPPSPKERDIPLWKAQTKKPPVNTGVLHNKGKAIVSEPVSEYRVTEQHISDSKETSFSDPEKKTGKEENREFGRLKVLGQFHDTYIICESDNGLMLIDQHAAHERILYEKFKTRSSTNPYPAQKLLIPETFDIGYREASVLEKLIPDFKHFGLEVEPFGGNTFVVKSVPSLISDQEVMPLILSMVDKVMDMGFSQGIEQVLEECLIIMACHGAIRANHSLSDIEMKTLLDQLDQCNNPSHCPHGRPTWISWTLNSLEKSFKRII